MDLFWKAIGGILIAALLTVTLGKQEKDLAAVLGIAACTMAATLVVSYMQPVFQFLLELNASTLMQSGILSVILKAVGITLVSELAAMVCADAGSSSLGKMLQLLGSAAVLSLSIPVFERFLSLIRQTLQIL